MLWTNYMFDCDDFYNKSLLIPSKVFNFARQQRTLSSLILNMDANKKNKALTLKTLNKDNVWDIQENDVFRLLRLASKDSDARDNISRYLDIIRSAFNIEEIKVDKPVVISKYEDRGFKVGSLTGADSAQHKYAVKKKSILRINDLTYENIRHITASKLIEVLDRNFGGGWESLQQSVQDIIESGFDVSTTTLPTDRLKKPGSLYERKVADGYEVLEIPKGSWTEAIFVKAKPVVAIKHTSFDFDNSRSDDDNEDEEDDNLPEDNYSDEDEDGDAFDDDKLTEESYRTTVDPSPEDLGLEAADVSDDDDEGDAY